MCTAGMPISVRNVLFGPSSKRQIARLPVGHVVAVAAGVELVAQARRIAEVQVVLLADAVLAGAVVDRRGRAR